MELRLLRQAKILHRWSERVEIPIVKIRVQFECERSLDIVLGLKVHLKCLQSVYADRRTSRRAYIDKLMDVFNVDLVPSNSPDEVHEAELEGQVNEGRTANEDNHIP